MSPGLRSAPDVFPTACRLVRGRGGVPCQSFLPRFFAVLFAVRGAAARGDLVFGVVSFEVFFAAMMVSCQFVIARYFIPAPLPTLRTCLAA